MTSTYVQPGSTIDHVAGSAISSGDVVVIGNILGVAQVPIDYQAKGRKRSLRVGKVAETNIEGIEGQGGAAPVQAQVVDQAQGGLGAEQGAAGEDPFFGLRATGFDNAFIDHFEY